MLRTPWTKIVTNENLKKKEYELQRNCYNQKETAEIRRYIEIEKDVFQKLGKVLRNRTFSIEQRNCAKQLYIINLLYGIGCWTIFLQIPTDEKSSSNRTVQPGNNAAGKVLIKDFRIISTCTIFFLHVKQMSNNLMPSQIELTKLTKPGSAFNQSLATD